MEKEKVIEKLKKLKALATRGVGGEAVNADRLFQSLCTQYHINPDDFDDEKIDRHAVKTENEEETTILSQIVWRRIGREEGVFGVLCKKLKRSDRKLLEEAFGVKDFNAVIKCTDAQFVEVMFEFEVLRQNYAERKRAFLRAFLDTNDLLLEPTEDDAKREYTDEELNLIHESARYSAFMDKAKVRKSISNQ